MELPCLDDIDKYDRNQLQIFLRQNKLRAIGSTESLRERLRQYMYLPEPLVDMPEEDEVRDVIAVKKSRINTSTLMPTKPFEDAVLELDTLQLWLYTQNPDIEINRNPEYLNYVVNSGRVDLIDDLLKLRFKPSDEDFKATKDRGIIELLRTY